MAKKAAAEAQTSIPGTEPTTAELAAAKERKQNKPLAMADAVKRVLELDKRADERCAEVEARMRTNLADVIGRAHGKLREKAKSQADAILARVPESERELADRVVRVARSEVYRKVSIAEELAEGNDDG